MIRKILIANRGEIAVRIIRACKEMGINTVAVYSDVDKEALHVKIADESVCIGPALSTKSYLNIKNVMEAACLTGADAIHPGFGFLSENSKFAKICKEANITFIGPSAEIIDLMGNKSKAKETMKKAGVPVTPGSNGNIDTLKGVLDIAKEIKYPIMIKAASGGGGKGIRLVNNEEELKKAYDIVKQEAKTSFNDDSIYVEKYIENPRHVEIQIMADEHGNVVHLGERDCSIQKRNQKVIEETPSTILTESLRKKMGEIAVKAAKTTGYTSVGTIEFLVDKNLDFYFMEMNTRVQVEHPVTEMITGIDIIKAQIKIANGDKLEEKQSNIHFNGHSMECRINAENAGKIDFLHMPGGNGIRIDTAIYNGYIVPPNYDSMIAKVIVHTNKREDSILKMKSALSEFMIEGIKTNIPLLLKILENDDFKTGNYDTNFIGRFQC